MYAGPAGHVDTNEYLTGRAVDKTFEQFKLGGAETVSGKVSSDIGYESFVYPWFLLINLQICLLAY